MILNPKVDTYNTISINKKIIGKNYKVYPITRYGKPLCKYLTSRKKK
jgi:hypothetical protein